MNCPACASGFVSVLKSMDSGSFIQRRRSCSCGARWTTEERMLKGTLVATGGQQAPPMASNQPPLAANGLGGVGGGLPSIRSESGPDPIRSISVSDPSLDHSQGVDRARAKRKADQPYSADFLGFWSSYPRKVGKGAAWKAWQQLQPDINRVISTLAWQTKSFEWRKDNGAFVPHPATYLNQRRWEDEPTGPTRAPAPPIIDIERAAQRAKQLENASLSAREEAAERFKQQREADRLTRSLADGKAVQ